MSKKILIIGAGISGLATAHWLSKENFDITILERNSEPGGAMITKNTGDFLVDFGPNSGLETTPLIRKIVDDIGISDQFIYANPQAEKRYILRGGELHALPLNPPAFIKTKLFSTKAKIRLAAEPFIGKSKDGYYQSVSEFVTRRLGREFLDYAINPFVSGVFAGDPDKLSVKSAFPKLYRLEEKYGGLIKGMIKGAKERKSREEESKQSAKMFSFKDGMQILPRSIADKLNADIIYNSVIRKIEKHGEGYRVQFQNNGSHSELLVERILSTIPAYALAEVMKEMDAGLCAHLTDIYYPPVMVLYLGYEKSAIGKALDGFGFLIPTLENKSFLGAIWSSTIFSNRSSSGKAAFTLFVGGAQKPGLFKEGEEELIRRVISEFSGIMSISTPPIFVEKKLWKTAIPQYNLGHIEHENYFEDFEKRNKGFFLGGNYRGGISVGDCVKNSEIYANKIIGSIK